ncbi:protein PLASTID MOVEMENT IMPAIRED 1 [Cornus florida]|uniref:protein PLASTID MOVEMENT IMPAIRED 1 n=1 Tax=Cornus florida TaxID=4283 RepID=UPI00289CD7E9|nr:protein PLASTID MOVEMENT IMPAIRED 1 [Cornus florida]
MMEVEPKVRRNSNTQLLEELEELSQSLYQSHTSTARRTASLVLPRTSVPPISAPDEIGTAKNEEKINPKPWSRRLSLSPWRSRPKLDDETEQNKRSPGVPNQKQSNNFMEDKAATEKKGLWNWKPIRALSHIAMQKLSCLFSVEAVTVQGLPASMNGLRLSICIRKKETKDGAVHTMPSRVSQGAADFEETLFIRCHVYCSPGSGTQLKFEPRPFLIYVLAVDAKELDFGRTTVDLSRLIQDSIEKSHEGSRIRQWETSFNLSGKAKGGELVLKLGFQIMEKDGGIGIYSQSEGQKSSKSRNYSSSIARRQSKSSFSVPSPRLSSRAEVWTPSQARATGDIQGMDDLNLDEPAPIPSPSSSSVQKSEEPGSKPEDIDILDFEVVDKGVEIQEKDESEEGQSEELSDKRSVSSEVVKEVVHDQVHLTRLTELDSIAQQIKALESMMGEEKPFKTGQESESQRLDAEEDAVTREFLQMLEDEDAITKEFKVTQVDIPLLKLEGVEDSTEAESKVFVSDLGKGLGCVVQTRDGGYLAAMNPLDTQVARKDPPKLAMQISKPLVLPSNMSGFELFQRMPAIGLEELSSEIFSMMPIDELIGKTAEQIAFEGIASAIIQGRNKEGASSSAARTIASVKTMASALSGGRKERISTGIWNVNENPLTVDEILAYSMQKIEAMSVEALKIQAEMSEEDAPFDVSPLDKKDKNRPLASAVPLEDWIKNHSDVTSDNESITISVVVQLRDPLRQYEAVGGPMIALIQASCIDIKSDKYDEEKKFKVASMHVGGLKVTTRRKRNVWDTEKQRLTAMQWLVAYGLGKAGKKGKRALSKEQDLLWSISSRVVAEMWLRSMRNPDVKFTM